MSADSKVRLGDTRVRTLWVDAERIEQHVHLKIHMGWQYGQVDVPGVRVIRHRYFEANWPLEGVDCPRDENGKIRHPLVFTHDKRKAHYGLLNQDESYVQVTGGGNSTIANKRAAMGMPWASAHGCNEAVPPAYGEIVGRQLMAYLEQDARAAA